MRIQKRFLTIFVIFSLVSIGALCLGKKLMHSSEIRKVTNLPNVNEVLILGSGCCGYVAANYLAMAGYTPVIIEGPTPGGLVIQSEAIRNWPGEIEITGNDLAAKLRKQVETNGAKIVSETISSVDFSNWPYKVFTQSNIDSRNISEKLAASIIIAMGTTPLYLNVPGEKNYFGRGVTNCATCDGSFYKDKVVAVVGGGDGAIAEASYLLKLVKKLYLIVRRDKFRAYDKRKDKVASNPKTTVLFNTEIREIIGDGNLLNKIKVQNNKTNEFSEIPVDGVFLAIGSKPNTEIFHGQIALDRENYIKVNKFLETSKDGIFAAGDIVDRRYKQAVTAAGDGAKAAIEANNFVERHCHIKKAKKKKEEKIKVVEKETPVKTESKAMPTPAPQPIVAPPAVVEQKIIEITSDDHANSEINSSTLPVIIDFYATWCGPCKMMHPVYEQLAKNFAGKIKFLKINVDNSRQIAQKYAVAGIPMFVFLDKTKKIKSKLVGAQDMQTLESNANKLLE